MGWGSWVAQLVEHPTLDFGLGHSPGVMEPIGDSPSLSLSLSAPLPRLKNSRVYPRDETKGHSYMPLLKIGEGVT